MTADISSQAFIRAHAYVIEQTAALVNLTGEFLDAEDGSVEEAHAQRVLTAHVDGIMQDEALGPNVLLALGSWFHAAASGKRAQRWLTEQEVALAAALDGDDG